MSASLQQDLERAYENISTMEIELINKNNEIKAIKK